MTRDNRAVASRRRGKPGDAGSTPIVCFGEHLGSPAPPSQHLCHPPCPNPRWSVRVQRALTGGGRELAVRQRLCTVNTDAKKELERTAGPERQVGLSAA